MFFLYHSMVLLECELIFVFIWSDLKETRPPQENEYLHSNNLSGSRLYNNYEGDESKCAVT